MKATLRALRLVLAIVPAVAHAAVVDDTNDRRAADPLRAGAPVSVATLDAMRGGFETPTGLRIAFGIERAVYIDGSLVTTTSFNVAESGRTAVGIVAGAGMPLALIQSGANNAFGSIGASPRGVATVIQNSLDDRRIQAVTTITAGVNSLELTRRAGLQSSIQDALTGSLRR